MTADRKTYRVEYRGPDGRWLPLGAGLPAWQAKKIAGDRRYFAKARPEDVRVVCEQDEAAGR